MLSWWCLHPCCRGKRRTGCRPAARLVPTRWCGTSGRCRQPCQPRYVAYGPGLQTTHWTSLARSPGWRREDEKDHRHIRGFCIFSSFAVDVLVLVRVCTLLAALRACCMSCRMRLMFSEMFGIWKELFCSWSSFVRSVGIEVASSWTMEQKHSSLLWMWLYKVLILCFFCRQTFRIL